MKLPFLTLLAALLSGAGSVHALPPAPFYTSYGTARDAVGQIVEVPGGAEQTPSLPRADPRSDRPRCGGRESDFPAVAIRIKINRPIDFAYGEFRVSRP